jgi:hypothetical protein
VDGKESAVLRPSLKMNVMSRFCMDLSTNELDGIVGDVDPVAPYGSCL